MTMSNTTAFLLAWLYLWGAVATFGFYMAYGLFRNWVRPTIGAALWPLTIPLGLLAATFYLREGP